MDMPNYNSEEAVRPAVSALAGTHNAAIYPTRAIYVGTDGSYRLTFAGATSATTVKGLVAGVVYPFSVTKIASSGGGAITDGDVLALY